MQNLGQMWIFYKADEISQNVTRISQPSFNSASHTNLADKSHFNNANVPGLKSPV